MANAYAKSELPADVKLLSLTKSAGKRPGQRACQRL